MKLKLNFQKGTVRTTYSEEIDYVWSRYFTTKSASFKKSNTFSSSTNKTQIRWYKSSVSWFANKHQGLPKQEKDIIYIIGTKEMKYRNFHVKNFKSRFNYHVWKKLTNKLSMLDTDPVFTHTFDCVLHSVEFMSCVTVTIADSAVYTLVQA